MTDATVHHECLNSFSLGRRAYFSLERSKVGLCTLHYGETYLASPNLRLPLVYKHNEGGGTGIKSANEFRKLPS